MAALEGLANFNADDIRVSYKDNSMRLQKVIIARLSHESAMDP
jgi:hypothetical protein